MSFPIMKKTNFDKIFEDAVVQPIISQTTQPPVSQPQQEPKKTQTKDDKLEKLKQYEEYWNFEKNYHFNSDLDSKIRKISEAYKLDKKQQIKLMKDIIELICGKAAEFFGLSWDIVGDDKYMFGFYETNGSKNHMQILIPYDFKFSNLKQKLLDWYLKKKESETPTDPNSEQKKPSIKIVESSPDKGGTSVEDLENDAVFDAINKENYLKTLIKKYHQPRLGGGLWNIKDLFLPNESVDLRKEYDIDNPNCVPWVKENVEKIISDNEDCRIYNVNDLLWADCKEFFEDDQDEDEWCIDSISIYDEKNEDILIHTYLIQTIIDDYAILSDYSSYWIPLDEIKEHNPEFVDTIINAAISAINEKYVNKDK